ncbi:NAD(P)H-dependent oxidoreductase [Rosenbergiella sp. S61]|uniref:NAD(P)H-dependent oxidoreductase n=1 Tax=Rosenbergiella gaditana TaxID=2726987 RepID=A0ABS5SUQ1_9GAMM|nr:NADPH-dependent FMN reductase [Rosenbergiella gaditana]MBT0723153.1 NAD(P)H-dependent oxidoreductase [Rosenbergiella gaditana]
MKLLKPDSVEFLIQDGLDQLPFFNPDFEDKPDVEVSRWRKSLNDANFVIFASPEYAHGITGVIKNALDWIVSSGELLGKPISLPNLSPRASIAHAQLAEILMVMGGEITESFSPKASLNEPYVIPCNTANSLCNIPEINRRISELWAQIEKEMITTPGS